jgi:tripartite-type tricarboxylate transporter receptor subunit TctC
VPWSALFVPAATPRGRVQKLNQAIAGVLQDPAFVARLADFGAEPYKISSAELATRITAESDRLARVIRDAKISIEQ